MRRGPRARSGEGRITPLARAFASKSALSREELIAAPVRWPRPVAPGRAPEGPGAQDGGGAALAGPADRRGPARAPPDRQPRGSHRGRPAGRRAARRSRCRCAAIAARPVRRRGMRPLVEASVFDSSGTMRATFFNQPWLVERYPPGTRLVLHGRPDARGGFARLPPRARLRAGARPRRRRVSRSPTTPPSEGVSSTEILASCARPAARCATYPRRCRPRRASASACRTAPSALAAMHFPRTAEDVESGRRRLAFEELLLDAAAVPAPARQARASGPARTCSTARATLTERWRERDPAVHAHRRPARRDGGDPSATWPGRARCTGC